ncbi:TonB-dependent receptor [Roseisolibacter sp. H3M3-2]|uniref:TonB-dependent receptor n=1 Tax=Roseisolibacter sp. H3M3-2 TaxID=3031323 RepID=UPI0023DB30C7|nr:TonB-dependent receptor [Roseisolibacter sp. H3M3-2]MDF1503787.1 TonB-dependent receptor [Roseisolibacter sp. H3M3-2]
MRGIPQRQDPPGRAWRSAALALLLAALPAAVAPLAAAPLAAQETDVIRGRVTNAEGLGLPGVRVTATSIPGNVTREARTNAQGGFQLAFAGGTGDYMMGYALVGYVYRQFQVKRLADEAVLVADARLAVVQLDTVAVVEAVQRRVSRTEAQPRDVGGTEQTVAPNVLPLEQQGDVAAMAASLPGVLLVPGLEGGPDGFSVLGLGADQNAVTLNGLPVGANGLPRDANVVATLTTSPYDVSRGGFSGANFNVRTGSGTNTRNRGASLALNAPQLQWTDRAANALGTRFTNLSLSGVLAGPIRPNKAFYNVSYQLGRNARDNASLLGTSALGLRTAGVAADSVGRLLDILGRRGVPVGGAAHARRVSDNGSLLASVDLSPPGSSSGQSFGVTVNANWGRQRPVGGGATQLPSASGDRMNWTGGVQARHSGYLGLLLSETSAGLTLSDNRGDPYVDLPLGRVRVASLFADGGSGVQSLTFGGNQGLSGRTRSAGGSLKHDLSWFDDANRHRLKLTTELQYAGSRQDPSSNLLGTFTFNSLEELEAGRPASFSRTLSVRQRESGQVTGSLAVGDAYRRTPDLQLQYGVRVDASRFTATPQYNPAVERAFGRRNDRVPTPVAVSPRVGFSWTLGRSPELEAFQGAARAPRGVLRGGLGMFANAASAGGVGAALDATGLPSGTQQIACVGPAVPTPDWAAYADDPALVPGRCADGSAGTVFSDALPNVTLVSPDYRPQRALRGNLGWTGSLLDARLNATVEATAALNLRQQRGFDLNFVADERFAVDGEGRPVFVDAASIVPATGALASRDARLSPAFARVTELRSDLRSRTAQLSLRLSPRTQGPSRFGWNAAYTYQRVREQASGFASTAGNPLDVEWTRAAQGPHQLQYALRYVFFGAVQVNWAGTFNAGAAYTPVVAGDVNGDGYANDRAFVFDPAAAEARGDAALAAGMRDLLAGTSGAARACLARQLGRIAARHSCRGPWTSNATLNVAVDRARFRLPRRTSASFSLSNPLGAADLLVNGSGGLRGWGQSAAPDPALLYVRGFDPATRRYRYEVNPRFGAARPQLLALRAPVTLTALVKVDLGPVRERQGLAQQLASGRTRPGTRFQESFFRGTGASALPNPMATILRQQDSLRLTAAQADSIAAMNRRYTYRSDSLWAPVARRLAALPARFDEDDAFARYARARRAQLDMLAAMGPAIRALLTPAQRRRLPASVLNVLDPRYLDAIRGGTGVYVGAGTLGGGD